MHKMEEILPLRGVRAALGLIPPDAIQLFVNILACLDATSSEDGGGLKNAGFVDVLFKELMKRHTSASVVHHGQADLRLFDVPLSFKTGRARTTFAINWSKNKDVHPTTFDVPLLFLIRTSGWWYKDCYVHKGFSCR